MQKRTCPTCGNTFKPSSPNQRFCPPTDEQRARDIQQPRSRCARRSLNHTQRAREGRQTIPLAAPIVTSFDCVQCGAPCVPGRDGVAPHASRFCGAGCKAAWHHKNVAAPRQAAANIRARRERQVAADMKRLMTWPPAVTAKDERAYAAVLRCDPCAYCGGPSEALDHVVPRAGGGTDDWTNRAGACHDCNGRKQNTPLLIYMGWQRARDEYEPWRQIVADICTRRAA